MKELYLDRTLRWHNLEKPTIAMVQGYCIFGGWMIASAMDIVFASEDALFLPSISQYFCAPWDIGPRKAKEVLFEHRFITAAEAREFHFVSQVFPREKLEEETLAYAGRVADNEESRVRIVKTAINHMMDATGFTSELEAAFHSYFIYNYWNWSEFKGIEYRDRKKARSDTALKNLESSRGKPTAK
jgi:enoyl-CoA hydratase